MKKFFLLLVLASSSAKADTVCLFYKYTCLPELNLVDIDRVEINNTEICQKVHLDEPFRNTLAQKGYVTTEGPTYKEGKWLLNGEPYISLPPQTCILGGQNFQITMTSYPQNENANGKCGGNPYGVNVSIQNENKNKKVFIGTLESACDGFAEIHRIRYSVSKDQSDVLETWGIDGEGKPFYHYGKK